MILADARRDAGRNECMWSVTSRGRDPTGLWTLTGRAMVGVRVRACVRSATCACTTCRMRARTVAANCEVTPARGYLRSTASSPPDPETSLHPGPHFPPRPRTAAGERRVSRRGRRGATVTPAGCQGSRRPAQTPVTAPVIFPRGGSPPPGAPLHTCDS